MLPCGMVSGRYGGAPRARSFGFGSIASLSCLVALGCHDVSSRHGGEPARTSEAVQSTGLGVFYGLAFAPAPSLANLTAQRPSASQAQNLTALARELAAQGEPYWASGAMTIPAFTALGSMTPLFAPAPATNRIRYSCGVTLVAPSYAITAGHCVTDDSDTTAIKLRLYRPTPALAKNYVPAPLSGIFPSYSQPKLAASDGYVFDQYDCTVVNRCYPGQDSSCPDSGKDMALLHCAGRPGDKYGFINVNHGGNPAGKEALMHWKHEVLDLGGPESSLPQDRIDHYVMLPSDESQNYHYFDNAADLLPLRSVTWSDGDPTLWLTSTATDTHGCHGSSGSGMLVRVGQTPVYELVGPAARSGAAFGNRLCEQVPNPGGSTSGEGTQALLADGMDPDDLVALHQSDITADCRNRAVAERDVSDLPFAAGAHDVSTVFSHLTCQIDPFGAGGPVTAAPVFGPYPETFVETTSASYSVKGFSLTSGSDYRASMQVMGEAPCTPDCGTFRLTAGTTNFYASPAPDQPSIAAFTFSPDTSGPGELDITSSGPLRAFGAPVLIREGQVNSFDTLEDRLEVGLYALDGSGNAVAGPLPMRFSGDGSAGFEALLLPGERLALLRQALAPGRKWTVRLGSASYDDLTCGLLDATGAKLTATACASLMHFDDHAGTDARLGFFVELASATSRDNVELRWVALASDAARDDDADGVPEVLDNCPGSWNPSQGSCNETRPPGAGGAGGEGGETGGSEGGAPNVGGATDDGGVGSDAGGEAGAVDTTGTGGSGGVSVNGGTGGASASAGTAAATAGTSGTAAGTSGSTNGGAGGLRNDTGGRSNGVAGAKDRPFAGTTGTGSEDFIGDGVGNKSGCACRMGGAAETPAGAWLALGLGGIALIRRRRPQPRRYDGGWRRTGVRRGAGQKK